MISNNKSNTNPRIKRQKLFLLRFLKVYNNSQSKYSLLKDEYNLTFYIDYM